MARGRLARIKVVIRTFFVFLATFMFPIHEDGKSCVCASGSCLPLRPYGWALALHVCFRAECASHSDCISRPRRRAATKTQSHPDSFAAKSHTQCERQHQPAQCPFLKLCPARAFSPATEWPVAGRARLRVARRSSALSLPVTGRATLPLGGAERGLLCAEPCSWRRLPVAATGSRRGLPVRTSVKSRTKPLCEGHPFNNRS